LDQQLRLLRSCCFAFFCGVVSMGIDVASLLLNYSRFNMISSLKSQQTLPRRLASMKFRNESPRIWLLGLFLTCCGYTWSSFFTFLVQLLTGCVHKFFFCGRQMLLFCLSFYVWQGNQTFVNHPSFLMRSWFSLFVNLHPIWNSQTGVFYVLSIVLPTAINLYTKYNWPHNIGVEENFRMLLQSYTTIIGSGKCWVHLMKSWEANGALFAGKVY